MDPIIDRETTRRLAGLELNSLNLAGMLPADFEGARVRQPTPIYDLNGAVLFYRSSVSRGSLVAGYVDIAGSPVFPRPLLAVGLGATWHAKRLVAHARATLGPAAEGAAARFVAYSYPKFGVQFRSDGKELALLDCATWEPVPPETDSHTDYWFHRWSYIDSLDDSLRRKRPDELRARIESWDAPRRPTGKGWEPERVDAAAFARAYLARALRTGRDLHFSSDDGHHAPCFEVYAQEQRQSCVAASVRMLLAFYRYEYDEQQLCREMGINARIGLPYGEEDEVVDALERLTSNALDANLNNVPVWDEFKDQLEANRPLISFIPHHSRAIAGYGCINPFLGVTSLLPSQWLRVYDPWDGTNILANQGAIRIEDFDSQSYRMTFTAELTHI